MRNIDCVIDEARLAVSSPESVVQYLVDRGARLTTKGYDTTDKQFEQTLLDRHEPLIDLALARWCHYDETWRALWAANQDNSPHAFAIRMSLLSNITFWGIFRFRTGPTEAFGEGFIDWLPTASVDELFTLFGNPTLDKGFLQEFLEGGPSWACLPEEHLRYCLYGLTRNPAINISDYHQWYDSEYCKYGSAVFKAAWNLAGTVPNTDIWADVLHCLFDVLLSMHYGFEDFDWEGCDYQRSSFLQVWLGCDPVRGSSAPENPLVLAARWTPVDEHGIGEYGQLSAFQRVRRALAYLALENSSVDRTDEFLTSNDPALRAAAYASRRLSTEQIAAAVKRDDYMGFNEMAENKQL